MWLQSVHRFAIAEDDRERLARLLRNLMRSPVSRSPRRRIGYTKLETTLRKVRVTEEAPGRTKRR